MQFFGQVPRQDHGGFWLNVASHTEWSLLENRTISEARCLKAEGGKELLKYVLEPGPDSSLAYSLPGLRDGVAREDFAGKDGNERSLTVRHRWAPECPRL